MATDSRAKAGDRPIIRPEKSKLHTCTREVGCGVEMLFAPGAKSIATPQPTSQCPRVALHAHPPNAVGFRTQIQTCSSTTLIQMMQLRSRVLPLHYVVQRRCWFTGRPEAANALAVSVALAAVKPGLQDKYKKPTPLSALQPPEACLLRSRGPFNPRQCCHHQLQRVGKIECQ